MLKCPVVLFYNLASEDSDRKGLPFIVAARELGWKTLVATHAPDSRMLCGDVNQVVPLAAWPTLHRTVQEHQVDFVMTVNSRLTPFVAELNKNLPIANFSKKAALALNHKDQCANLCSGVLQAPRHWLLKKPEDWLQIPKDIELILKPSFSTGAVDTWRFADVEALHEFLARGDFECQGLRRRLSLSEFYNLNLQGEYFGHFLVQEYIAHEKQIGMELLVVQGQLHLVHSARILTAPPQGIHAYAHVGPVEIPSQILQALQKLIDHLGIRNAHLTPDFLLDERGQWFLIDANMNPGGEGLLDAIAARGLNYAKESLKAFAGQDYSLKTEGVFTGSFAKPDFRSGNLSIHKAETFQKLCEVLC